MANLSGLELRSRITSGGKLELSLEEVTAPVPAADEVVIRVEAAPVNPSDLGMLLGPADVATFKAGGTVDRPSAVADVPQSRLAAVTGRLDQSMPVVVAAAVAHRLEIPVTLDEFQDRDVIGVRVRDVASLRVLGHYNHGNARAVAEVVERLHVTRVVVAATLGFASPM